MLTFRRHYLDQELMATKFSGRVLDVGGENRERRGTFRRPTGVDSWVALNSDPATGADVIASADNIPLPDGSFDCVVITEVLEHVESPARVLAECHRTLKPGGALILSTPFLYCVHGDPSDFTRWTSHGLARLLESGGFREVEIKAMGGIVASTLDLFENYCHHLHLKEGRLPWRVRALRILVRRVLGGFFLRLDRTAPFADLFTTGYFVRAVK